VENDLGTDSSARWYVVYTYSGYENKVKATLEKIVENKGIQDKIQEIIIPMEEDETWYVVKNIKGVFNFVGVGDKPLPLTEKDMQSLGIEDIINLDFEVGDSVRITTEPFYNYPAIIEEIFKEKKRVKVKVSMFGRETTVDLEFNQIQKI